MVNNYPEGFISVNLNNYFDYYQNSVIGANQRFCNNCERMSDVIIENKKFTSPEVMTIILDRVNEFEIELEYPLKINIDKYVMDNNISKNNDYDFICVLAYIVPSGKDGYFIALCKSPINETLVLL